MKLKEAILNPIENKDGTKEIPLRVLKVKPDVFPEMYTFKNAQQAIGNGTLLNNIASKWNDIGPSSMTAEITELYLDARHIYHKDTRKKLICKTDAKALGEADVENLIVSRGVAKIEMKGLHTEFSPAIAVNISENGDEMAWGNSVFVCSNLTIMNAENRMSTYKSVRGAGGAFRKPDQKEVLKRLEGFMKNTVERFENELIQIEKLKKIEISKEEWYRFLGIQYSKIQMVNHHRVNRSIRELDDTFLPLSGIQLSRIAIESEKPSYQEYAWIDGATSKWNAINYGTEILKMKHGADGPTLLKSNSNFVELIKGFSFS